MIKTIHKYQKSIISVLLMLVVCLSMLFFGMDTFSDRSDNYAAKIGDAVLSYGDFARQRKALENMYRARFGDYYHKLRETEGWDLEQQVIDRIVPATLLTQFARQLGLHVGKQELRSFIGARFPGGFSAAAYRMYLNEMNLSAKASEVLDEREALLNQFQDLVTDFSGASRKEALSLLQSQKTLYAADYIEIVPNTFEGQVPTPADDILEEFYTEQAVDYELPPRLKYSYVAFKPAEQFEQIEVLDEDIELYYVDHQDDYMVEPEARVNQIKINVPPNSTTDQREEVRLQAEEILQLARSGEDFASLVLEHSEDLLTKTTGGGLGLLTPHSLPEVISKAVFRFASTGIPDLVSAEDAFYVLNVEYFQAAIPKDLELVKEEIIQKIKEQEAPGYASVKAQEEFDLWTAGGKSLKEYAADKKLALLESPGLLTKDQEAGADFKGLNKKVFEFPEEKKKLVELQDLTVVVEITEHLEREIPVFKDVKEKVLKDYRSSEAKKLALKTAEEIIEKFKAARYSSLKEAAEEYKQEIQSKEDISRTKLLPKALSNPEATRRLFATFQENETPQEFFEHEGNYVIFQVTKINKPKPEELTDELDQYLKQATQLNADTLLRSLVNQLKTETEIEINPGLLGG